MLFLIYTLDRVGTTNSLDVRKTNKQHGLLFDKLRDSCKHNVTFTNYVFSQRAP